MSRDSTPKWSTADGYAGHRAGGEGHAHGFGRRRGRRRGGAGGTTFPARARSRGITTSCPLALRTVNELSP